MPVLTVPISGHWVECECGKRWFSTPDLLAPGNDCPACQRPADPERASDLTTTDAEITVTVTTR